MNGVDGEVMCDPVSQSVRPSNGDIHLCNDSSSLHRKDWKIDESALKCSHGCIAI